MLSWTPELLLPRETIANEEFHFHVESTRALL
jgi:hypothetical protein